jgi:uncharacterized protein YciI
MIAKYLFVSFLSISTVFFPLAAQDKAYMIVILNKKSNLPKLSPEESKKLSDGHFANINRLAKEKKLLAAGPFDGGGGIFVMNTNSPEDVQEWISPDPGIKAERWDVEVLPYLPRQGGICQQSDTAKMVTYTFIRYHVLVAKYTAAEYPEIIRKHNTYLADIATGNDVITEASFGDRDGGLMILTGEPAPDLFSNDPGIQEGLIEPQVKKLYIAKGSFCEK